MTKDLQGGDLGSANDSRASRLEVAMFPHPFLVLIHRPVDQRICHKEHSSTDPPGCSQGGVTCLIFSSVESKDAQSCSKPTELDPSHTRSFDEKLSHVVFDHHTGFLMERTCHPALGRLWWEKTKD